VLLRDRGGSRGSPRGCAPPQAVFLNNFMILAMSLKPPRLRSTSPKAIWLIHKKRKRKKGPKSHSKI